MAKFVDSIPNMDNEDDNGKTCVICGNALTGKQTKYCSPRCRADGQKSTASAKSGGSKSDKLTDKLSELIGNIGIVVLPFDDVCGLAVVQQAPPISEALVEASKENDRVRAMLERIVETSAWAQVGSAFFPLIITILSHHNLLPGMVNATDNEQDNGQPPTGIIGDMIATIHDQSAAN